MEVQFTPDVEAKLQELAEQTGRGAAEFVQDAVAGYVEDLRGVRELLDRRYDDLASGRIQGIDGDEALAQLRRKSELQRAQRKE